MITLKFGAKNDYYQSEKVVCPQRNKWSRNATNSLSGFCWAWLRLERSSKPDPLRLPKIKTNRCKKIIGNSYVISQKYNVEELFDFFPANKKILLRNIPIVVKQFPLKEKILYVNME